MALTVWESVKVTGHAIAKLGEQGDKFEHENPEKKFKPTLNDISEVVIATVTELGVEIAD